MKVHERLKTAEKQQETLLSLEIIPPFKGEDIRQLFLTLDKLISLKPTFINVTTHPAEYKFLPDTDFLNTNKNRSKQVIYKRPGTLSICAAIAYRYKITTVAHLICAGEDNHRSEEKLIELNYLNLQNVLALQGDIKEKHVLTHKPRYASSLVKQIANLSKGIYLEKDLANSAPMHFSIGVAGYPEKHFMAASLADDISYLKQKVDNGAHYIVTQMFFDNKYFFRFRDSCRKAGITIPIVAGLKPITTYQHLEILPKLFHISIPQELQTAIEKAPNKEAVRKVGIDWAIRQSLELKQQQVPCLHFYTMNRPKVIQEIVSAVF